MRDNGRLAPAKRPAHSPGIGEERTALVRPPLRRARPEAKRTGELLMERGLLTRTQVEAALAHQRRHGGRLGEIVARLGFLSQEATERELACALTARYGTPYLSLAQYHIAEDVIRLVPAALARRHHLIPVDRVGNALSIAMTDPSRTEAIQDVQAQTCCVVQAFVSSLPEIEQAIARYYQQAPSDAVIPPAPERRAVRATGSRRAGLQACVLEALLADRTLDPGHVEQAQTLQRAGGGALLSILVEQGFVQEADLLAAISQALGIPLINLSRVKVDPALTALVPSDLARHEQLLPVSRMGQTLTVAMADPLNVFALDTLATLTGLSIRPVLARSKDIRETVGAHYGVGVEETVEQIVQEQAAGEGRGEGMQSAEDATDANQLLQLTQALPIVRMTDAILSRAVALRASDLLIEPSERQLFIRYRVDGLLQEGDAPPRECQQAVISRVKVMAGLNIAERRLPQDGHFSFRVDGQLVDCRVSVIPAVFGEKVAIRILDKAQAKLDAQTLGFAPDDLERLRGCIRQPYGMVLTTGPTGSGKTTTLYALLKILDRPEKNLVTVEDPIEFRLSGINQVSAKSDTGLTFAQALRSILRQDPDIIMVGEIRDGETADMVVKSALTGHLVLSTLHTTSATGAIVRLLNMGVEPFLLSSCLLAVVGQRLVRRLCPHCQQLYTPPKQVAKTLGLVNARGQIPQLARGAGCRRCAYSGYHGRELIAEVFVVTPEIRQLIVGSASLPALEHAAKQAGMRTLREHGLQKAVSHVTSLEEVFRTTIGELVVE